MFAESFQGGPTPWLPACWQDVALSRFALTSRGPHLGDGCVIHGQADHLSSGQPARLQDALHVGLVAARAAVDVVAAGQPPLPGTRWCTRLAGGFATVPLEALLKHRVHVAAVVQSNPGEDLGRAETLQHHSCLEAASTGGAATVQALAPQEATRGINPPLPVAT